MTNPYFNASGEPGTGAFAASAPMRTEFQSIQAGFALLPALTANKAVVINSAGTAQTVTVGSLALAGDFATVGAFAVALVASAAVNLTLPAVDGTLATLAGTETFSNKTFGSNVALGTPVSGTATNLTGTAAGLTAGNDTTNASLTGPITSVGNVTSIGAQTGTGSTFVVQTSPTLITPVLGVATATSINKVTITAPASAATLTIADGKTLTASASITLAGTDGKTLTVSNNLTLAGTDATVMTFPSTSATIARTDAAQTFTGAQTFGTQQSARGQIILANTVAHAYPATLQSSNSATAATTITLPPDAGSIAYYLQTDGSGNTAWAPGTSAYSTIATHTVSGSELTISFTNVNVEDILIEVSGLTNDTGNTGMLLAPSIDNGSNYGTPQVIGTSISTTTAKYGPVAWLTGAKAGPVMSRGSNGTTATAAGITSSGSTTASVFAFFNLGAKMNAFQLTNPNGGNFTAGTVTILGRG